jgi:hypothetical protein
LDSHAGVLRGKPLCDAEFLIGPLFDLAAVNFQDSGGGPRLDVTGGENSRVTFTLVKDRIPLVLITIDRFI